jgi:hypothetical protein
MLCAMSCQDAADAGQAQCERDDGMGAMTAWPRLLFFRFAVSPLFV